MATNDYDPLQPRMILRWYQINYTVLLCINLVFSSVLNDDSLLDRLRLYLRAIYRIPLELNSPQCGLQANEHQKEDQEEEDRARDSVDDGRGDGVGDHCLCLLLLLLFRRRP